MAARAHFGIAEFALGGSSRPCRRVAPPWSACRSRCPAPARPARTRPAARAAVSSSYTEFGPPERMMPAGAKSRMKCVGDVVGMQFAVDAGFAHAAGDQLGVLGTEIEDEDFLVHGRPSSGRKEQGRSSEGAALLTTGDASFNVVVRRFLGDLHVVHVRFADAGRGDFDELGLGTHARRWWRRRGSPCSNAGRPSAGGSRPARCPCRARGLRCLPAPACRRFVSSSWK